MRTILFSSLIIGSFILSANAQSVQDIIGVPHPVHFITALKYRIRCAAERQSYVDTVVSRVTALQKQRRSAIAKIDRLAGISSALERLLVRCGAEPDFSSVHECIASGEAILEALIEPSDYFPNDAAAFANLETTRASLIEVLQRWHTLEFDARLDKSARCNSGVLFPAELDSVGQPGTAFATISLLARVLITEAQSSEEAVYCRWVPPSSEDLTAAKQYLLRKIDSGETRVSAHALCHSVRNRLKENFECDDLVLDRKTLSSLDEASEQK